MSGQAGPISGNGGNIFKILLGWLGSAGTTISTGLLTAAAGVGLSRSAPLALLSTVNHRNKCLQGNAGNDTIALGDELVLASAATFAGGQGNDHHWCYQRK